MRATSAAGSVVTSDGGSSAPGIVCFGPLATVAAARDSTAARARPSRPRRPRGWLRPTLPWHGWPADRPRHANGRTPAPATAPSSTAADECAVLLGDGRHVEPDVRLARCARPRRRVGLRQRGRRRAPTSRRSCRRGASMRSTSYGRASRSRAARYAAASTRLGGHDDVDVARARHQRHHRAAAIAGQRGLREELEVVERRTGALRHAGTDVACTR